MNEKTPTIETDIADAVDELIQLLVKKDEIIRYQSAEKSINQNQWIQNMIQVIKGKQQELVNFEYYEKPQAYQKTLQELEVLNQQLEDNITVRYYRDTLFEADEIVQHLFSFLQDAIEQDNQ